MVHKSEEHKGKITFKIFVAENINIIIFWDATSRISGDGDRRFGGAYCLHLQCITLSLSLSFLNCSSGGRFRWTIGIYLPMNTASCQQKTLNVISYVYGTVHHLDSWVKRKPTWCHLFYYFIQCSFNAKHVSAVNTTIFRSMRLIGCYFMGCIWFGVCWRSVSVWLWRCGVFMQSEALNEHWIK